MKVPGIPFDPGKHPQGPLAPTAIVLHRTYGAFGKDGYRSAYAIGKNGRAGVGIGFHFLIGKNAGQVVQFYDTATEAAHAKGANSWSVGIEFDGVNEDVLTDWQVAQAAWIIAAVCDAHRIPRIYTTAGVRRRVAGCLPHALVPGSDHTDAVTVADWTRIAAHWTGAATPATTEEDAMTPQQRDEVVGRLDEAIGLLRSIHPAVAQIQTGVMDPVAGVRTMVVQLLGQAHTAADPTQVAQAIAQALPDDLARQVADELAARLAA